MRRHDIDPAVLSFLERSGLVRSGAKIALTPLAGGVASDIWEVEAGSEPFVVKRALARLRVEQEWTAPVSRSASEVAWMRAAGSIVPGAVPAILADDAASGLFAMSYLDPDSHPVWKQELKEGRADPAFAASLGRLLAKIHAATAGSEELARRFMNDDVFRDIRIAPYIEIPAALHPDIRQALMTLAASTLATKRALVHGDVSPKNVLCGPEGPVFLDAECAWYGDPAFDLAFCLNHLLLKCLWAPAFGHLFLACFDALSNSYLSGVTWEPGQAIEARAARLLPALLLGRVDGKSPVEYLTDDLAKSRVRRVARRFIAAPPGRLTDIRLAWTEELSR
jgi:aminoglycoside phosphotransferase (APT) family kinase protein